MVWQVKSEVKSWSFELVALVTPLVKTQEGRVDIKSEGVGGVNSTEILQGYALLDADLHSEQSDGFSPEIDLN